MLKVLTKNELLAKVSLVAGRTKPMTYTDATYKKRKFSAKDSLMAIRTTFIMSKSHPFFKKVSLQRSLFGDNIP